MKKVWKHLATLKERVLKIVIPLKVKPMSGIAGIKDGTQHKKYVTLGWDGLPTIVNNDGTVFPRQAELIFNKKYYPNWPIDQWPVDPETGIKLEIEI